MTLAKLPGPPQNQEFSSKNDADTSKLPPLGKWNISPKAASVSTSPVEQKTQKTSRVKKLCERAPHPSSSGSLGTENEYGKLHEIPQVEARKLEWTENSTTSSEIYTTKSGWQYLIKEGSVPCFEMLRSKLPDPLTFYEEVEPIGRHFGAVVLQVIEDPLKSEKQSATALDPERLHFKARKQALRPPHIERQRKLDFYRKLHHHHTVHGNKDMDSSLQKIPSIDRRPLDLYRLRQCVLLRGGYQAVCNKKAWAQISRELGYSRRASTSLLSTLRSTYAKILLDFDEQTSKSHNADNVVQQELGPKHKIILPSSKTHEAANGMCKKRVAATTTLISDNSTKRQKVSKLKAYKVIGTGVEYPRLRDILQYKGFVTKFESLTDGKKHITKPSVLTLPNYDFSFWRNTTAIFDQSPYEASNSPFYNLIQYSEKSHLHSKQVFDRCVERLPHAISNYQKMGVDKFERLFHQVLLDVNVPCDVDSAINLPSRIHGSAFPKASRNGDGTSTNDSWSLSSMPLSSKSALCFLNADYGDHVSSHLDIGMLFSIKGWAVEDSFLPAVDYHHVGSSKLWYVVSPQDLEKFEQLMSTSRDAIASSGVITDPIKERQFRDSVLFQCFNGTTQMQEFSGMRSRINTHSFPLHLGKGTGFAPELDQLYGDLLLHPEIFELNDIKIRKVIQNPGSYIFKFPKTYAMNIHSGFGVSENVHFATASWLDHLLDSELWLAKHGILSSINSFQLLHTIISESKDKSLVTKASNILLPLITDELEAREKLTGMSKKLSVCQNTFDFVSDLDYSSTGASKVLLANADDCITLSLKQFQVNSFVKDGRLHVLGQDVDNDWTSVSLHLLYPNEDLDLMLQQCRARKKAAMAFSRHLNDLGKEEKAPILAAYIAQIVKSGKRLRFEEINMYNEALSHFDDSVAKNLNKIVGELRIIRSKCVQFLRSVQSRLPKSPYLDTHLKFDFEGVHVPEFQYSVTELFNLQKEIQNVPVEFPEMQDIFSLCRKVKRYQTLCKVAIQKNDVRLIRDAFVSGFSLGVSSIYQKQLAKSIGESLWLEEYNRIFLNRPEAKTSTLIKNDLEDLPLFLEYGLRYVRKDEHMEKFREVRRAILSAQNILFDVKSLFKKKNSKVSVDRLQELFSAMAENRNIIDPRLKEVIEAVLDAFEKTKLSYAAAFAKLNINDQFLSEVTKYTTVEALNGLAIIERFDGSLSDQRLTQQEVPNKSIFAKHVKDCRAWLHALFSAVSKRQSWGKVVQATEQCLGNEADIWQPASTGNAEKDEFYCFCRRGDFGSTMVACEICGEWYHMTCINKGKWSLGDSESSVFVCPICCSRDISGPNVIHYDDLQKLIIESCHLKIIPDRQVLTEVFEIFKLAFQFKRTVRNSVLDPSGTVKSDVPLSEIKFYLRKLAGSGVKLVSEEQTLRNACRGHDAKKIQELAQKTIKVVTGLENADERPRELASTEKAAEELKPSEETKPPKET
ncbi:LAFA_0G21374g1_1 [Lachancea sp. 'fantastica']|nr:LAFA_0G21374g1_1 [Lachancea sp. 'fantastica']